MRRHVKLYVPQNDIAITQSMKMLAHDDCVRVDIPTRTWRRDCSACIHVPIVNEEAEIKSELVIYAEEQVVLSTYSG
jgi:hypothetical protein